VQFGVFGFGLLEDGNIRIDVFPEGQEFLIRLAGLGGIALQDGRASQTQIGENADGLVLYDTGIIDDLLKLGAGGGICGKRSKRPGRYPLSRRHALRSSEATILKPDLRASLPIPDVTVLGYLPYCGAQGRNV
jgi:hypothetical protein